MSIEKRFYVALKGAIFNGDKFLIVKRSEAAEGDNMLWELPGGRMEFGETPEQALIRELREEVGLNVDIIKPIKTWSSSRDESSQLVGITCLCRYKGGDVRLSQEHLEYAWIGYDEVCNYDMAPDIAEEIDSWDKEEIRRILL
jgi:8-oxo-dGTP diphosphatase